MSLALHEIAEAGHRILNPLTDAHLRELGAVARIGPGTRILDLASGKAEMLCRWAQEYGSSGVGVDLSGVFTAAARHRVAELRLESRVQLVQADASTYQAEVGTFDVGACLGATWIGGGLVGTIELLRPAVKPGGLLLVGEPYWREAPPAEARAANGDHPEEFADLPGLLDRFEQADVELVEMVAADEHSWDRYAASQWWTLREWLDTHPDSAIQAEVRRFLDESRRLHLTYQRRYLGWAVFVLRLGS